MGKYDEELKFAIQLSEKATTIAAKYYRSKLNFHTKEDSSPVTIADEEINSMVVQEVKRTYQEHGILGEEESHLPDRDHLWICDPIDGTIAFSIGIPTFMFSLALTIDGVPVVAVVKDLANDILYTAQKGGGAFSKGKLCAVSSRPMNKSWFGLPGELNRLQKFNVLYTQIDAEAYQTCAIHGAACKGTLLSSGFIDGYVVPDGGKLWDYAAVSLLVTEAGGKVTDLRGGIVKFNEQLKGLILSNGTIHERLLEIVAKTIL